MLRTALISSIFVIIVFVPVAAYSAPAEQVIQGSPLTIRVGSDTSFQVLNASIGTIGQIFPPCATSVGDAGIFATVQGQLYAPDFTQHPCGHATGSIGASFPWTLVSMSGVSGTGTSTNPFTVTLIVDAGTTGVRLKATYTYVNGDPFFRMTKVFTSTGAVSMNVYVGADIYLGGSDYGVPYLEPTSSSPGGRDCSPTPTYTILIIPTTPADHYTARYYDSVWTEIGTHGNLTDVVATGCIDNGAAVQWQRTLLPGGSTTITSAVSFGPIPPIVQFNVTSVSPPQGNQGQTLTVVISGVGFQNTTTFDFGPGINVGTTTINSSTQATVTITIAPTATPGPRNVTGTQSPGGLTATLINGFTVLETPQCGRLVPSQVLCTTDGSGDYLVTFTFQNLSHDTIQHLFLTGLSGGATATPNYIQLTAPVAPGGSATVGPIRIQHAQAGTLSLTVSIYNVELAHCCTFDVRLELPDCSCAQIRESSGPSCRFPAGGYTYAFSYQNLYNGPIQQLLITPDVPSTVTYSPNVIVLNPPMTYGETRTFTIVINNASASQQVCLRITSSSDRCEHCCTIRRCVFLPRCTRFPVDATVYLGDTHPLFDGQSFAIESASHEPGCVFPLAPDTKKVDLAWQPITESLPVGSFVEQRYRGSVGAGADAAIATTRTVTTATGSELQTTFGALNSTGYQYVFRNHERVVGVQSGVPNDMPTVCNGCGVIPTRDAHFSLLLPFGTPASQEGPPACDPPFAGQCLFAGYTFPQAGTFNLAKAKYEADEVRVYPENAGTSPVRLSAVEFRAHGPSRITFTDLQFTVDCNGNGIDDLNDIASGASLDIDRNGVPDECQSRGADLDLPLNTGFDQTRGVILPGGSADDDWRVTNTSIAGAAKVVQNPVSSWALPFPQSTWISVSPDRGDSIPGVTTLQFENCFCIGSGATTASLDLQVRADNFATVYLNDANVSETGGPFNGSPLTVHVSGGVGGNGPFRVGRNCVRVDVSDQGGLTGLNVAGTVRAPNGSCPPAVP